MPAVVGVEGKTLTELWGERPSLDPEADETPEGEASEADEVLEALECVCWWWMPLWYVLLMEETDEEVDLRPRRPAEERR